MNKFLQELFTSNKAIHLFNSDERHFTLIKHYNEVITYVDIEKTHPFFVGTKYDSNLFFPDKEDIARYTRLHHNLINKIINIKLNETIYFNDFNQQIAIILPILYMIKSLLTMNEFNKIYDEFWRIVAHHYIEEF